MVAGQFLFVVDAFIVNVAIPSIHADLGTTAAVIAIYQIAYATLVITGGRLGNIFGRKPGVPTRHNPLYPDLDRLRPGRFRHDPYPGPARPGRHCGADGAAGAGHYPHPVL